MAGKIKKRNEMDTKYTWATEDLYADDKAWRVDFEGLKEIEEKLSGFQGRLSESAESLYGFLRCKDELNERLDRVYHYVFLKHDEDTKNSTYQELYSMAGSEWVKINSILSFEQPELIALSDEVLKGFYEKLPELSLYERYIKIIREKKEHILSENEERLLAMAGEMSKAPSDIRETAADADLTFPSIKGEDGEEEAVTNGSFIVHLESGNQRVRKDAYESLYSVYMQFENTFAALLNAQVKQLSFFAKTRNYKNTLQAALADTEVPEMVYHNLIETVSEHTHHMHRYVRIRKKMLNLPELHFYDLYMPIVKKADVKVSFEKAKQQVYEALAPLGEEYQKLLKKGFENRWIDVYENEGKRSGAYSAGARLHPFVLLNYKDTLDNEFTLAHEMGHALHSYLSNKHQPIVYSDYKIFVAEVASTCNEALLMRYLLKQTADKTERAYLINHFLDGFRTTLYRQTMFAEFELMINRMEEGGEAITAERLKTIYRDLNLKYYGSDIVIDDYICTEWARIPHFFYNFYVYQYATGYSAAIALSERILNEGAPAVENYLKFLSSGASADPISLLKIAGIDMSTAEPIRQALKFFGELLDEMEELA